MVKQSGLITVEQAIARLQAGEMVIICDDEHRENEGDICVAAQYITPEKMNFMITHARGLVCMPMSSGWAERLGLSPMIREEHNRSKYHTAFTQSIGAAQGVGTGISAHDRAYTIRLASSQEAKPSDIISPGHIFPLIAREKGVLERQGHTEASIDLMHLAGLPPCAAICEVLAPSGLSADAAYLNAFSEMHDIPMITVKALMEYRIQKEVLVSALVTTRIPLQKHGDFSMTVFENSLDKAEHFVLEKKTWTLGTHPLVRIHSECITGDVFGSCKCDCGAQLEASLTEIAEQGGILIYLRQEGRGIGLANKLKAYALQEQGYDTVDANIQLGLPVDNRDYAVAFQILKYYDITHIRLLTNNPQKISALEDFGIVVSERLPVRVAPNPENHQYLRTKKIKLGHMLMIEEGICE